MTKNKKLIHTYLEAVSGKSKPQKVLDQFITDTKLKEHICFFQTHDGDNYCSDFNIIGRNKPSHFYDKYVDDHCVAVVNEQKCESVPCRIEHPKEPNQRLYLCKK